MDSRWKWLQMRINSSLRPKLDDLNKIFSDERNCLAARSFFSNEDVRKLFVYVELERKIILSTDPPPEFHRKSVFFFKGKPGIKLTAENLDGEVLSVDCGRNVLENLGQLTRDVYLPLLCTNVGHADAFGVSADKLMDALHRLLASVETTRKSDQGEVVLALPSVEVLAEVSANKGRRVAVLHVLETMVVGWSKQIEKILKHDPVAVLHSEYGDYPGPLDEVELWMSRRAKLSSILRQLKSPVAVNIFQSLKNANSSYITSFQKIIDDVNKATEETDENLMFLETMNSMFDSLHICTDPKKMAKIFPPLVHTLYLLWMHSKYYHQSDKFRNLLGLILNAIIWRAEAIVGDDILINPAKSYVQIKETVQACACFRGVYLDYREKTNEINKRNMEELAILEAQMPKGQFGLLSVKMYGPYAYKPQQGTRWKHRDEIKEEKEDKLKTQSLWPPRNAKEFDRLNAYIERCNDVLELVETIQHFQLLATTAEIGGAGSMNLDVLVREIYQKYSETIYEFLSRVPNVLMIDENDGFAESFFVFRLVIKDLEKKMADVLHQGFLQCPTTTDRLRLLEVFEGISGRHLIQALLKDEFQTLVQSFTEEVRQTQRMFAEHKGVPPTHRNMPAIVSRLLWVHALKQRIEVPMAKMHRVSPHLLKGELGQLLIHLYNEVKVEMDRYQSESIADWQNGIPSDLTDRLNQPLLTSTDIISEETQPLLNVSVQLDPKLVLLLREIYYLSREPFFIDLPHAAKVLVESIDFNQLRTTLTRLEMIVSKYNSVMRIVTPYELELFNRTLSKIWQLFTLGATDFTWCTEETADFLELANSLVCVELYDSLDVVQMNCRAIVQATEAWSRQRLDVFSDWDNAFTYNINELKLMQEQINKNFESTVVPAGNHIQKLLSESFKAVEISEASPAWQEYVSYVDTVVLSGLKSSCLSSLQSMLKRIGAKADPDHPLLVIRMELIQGRVVFSPPLDPDTITESLSETIENWLNTFVARGHLVVNVAGNTSFHDYVEMDEEVQQLLSQIKIVVKKQMDECKQMLSEFEQFSALWKIHMHEEFQKFLKGEGVDGTLSRTPSMLSSEVDISRSTSAARASSTRSGQLSQVQLGQSEREFLSLPPANTVAECRPTLDDFEAVLECYKGVHDTILNIPDEKDVVWIRVDTRPIKLVSTAYAKLIMFAYTQYLSEQVTKLMDGLDRFLETVEPEIEGITGEERDTASFMRIMRTFHTVSAKQQEMEGKFVVVNRAVHVLDTYNHRLPEQTQVIYNSMSGRWTNLKTKVGQAKQKIGPRIREESASISKDLILFGETLKKLYNELKESEAHEHTCSIESAILQVESFTKRLDILENEAQDLMELQEFLETSLVDFSLLRRCHQELGYLRQVWHKVQSIGERQKEWKNKRWAKVKIGLMRQDMEHQRQRIEDLPMETLDWDVTARLKESVNLLITYALVIEYLSCPSMRPRHWKQLMTITGGVLNTDSELLKTMTLGELLHLQLDKHLDEVRLIAERADLDITIERCLKKYEEIWLSKVFDLEEHVRSKAIMINEKTGSNHTAAISDTASEASCTSGVAKRPPSNVSSHNRMRHASVLSLPNWLVVIGDNVGPIYLILNMDAILEELESHQVSLRVLQADSGIGTFMDDVHHWQKTLQVVEVILHLWAEVQEKWIELEEVYSSQEMSSCLPTEFGIFTQVNQDFKRLMVTVKDNNNVLQCCQRASLKNLLESLNSSLEKCWKSLRQHLEFRRQKFPRFYFLSTEDILHIMCNGYDVLKANHYIHKLFENIGTLVFEKLETAEKSLFQITAVKSHLRESLTFLEPVLCEGGVEKWLFKLMIAMKSALKAQLMAVVNVQAVEKTAIVTNELDKEKDEEIPEDEKPSEEKQEVTDQFEGQGHSNSREEDKYPMPGETKVNFETVLSHVTEIVLIATRLAVTNHVELALQGIEDGTKDALMVAIDESSKRLESAIQMLTNAKRRSGIESQSSDGALHPGQIAKLASLVVLWCYERDLLGRLQTDRTKALENDFLWRSQLQYRLQEDGASVEIKCLNSAFDYGFEYMGSTEQTPIVPETEKTIFSLTSALHTYSSGLCVGLQVNVVRQLSQYLGRPFFPFHCTNSTDYGTLCNMMKGLASAGAWVCFIRLSQLRPDVMSCFGELLRSVITALQTRQSSVGILGDELSVDPSGSCLATLDPFVRIGRNDPQQMMKVPMAALDLPRDILDHFRVISLAVPSIRQTAEVLLLSQGFSDAARLAHKMSTLFESGQQVFDECNYSIAKDSKTKTGNVWNLHSLHCLVRHASAVLDKQHDLCGESMMDIKIQDRAVVTALKEVVMPRFTEVSSLIFVSLIQDLWPDVDMMSLGFVGVKPCGNLPKALVSSGKTRSGISHDSTGANSPQVTFDPKQCLPDQMLSVESNASEDHITSGARKLGLVTTAEFHSDVSRLQNLTNVHQTVIIMGPVGCGKTSCIRTLAAALRNQGLTIHLESVFTKALESDELFGHYDPQNHCWSDGLLSCKVRELTAKAEDNCISFIHLDGTIDVTQSELFQAVLKADEGVVLQNGERMILGERNRFIWETDDLSELDPSIVSSAGVICMEHSSDTWKRMLASWLIRNPEEQRKQLRRLCDRYLLPTFDFLRDSMENVLQNSSTLQRIIWQSDGNVISTFIALLEALVKQNADMTEHHLELCFNFSCIWAFGAMLDPESKETFSGWWRKTFDEFVQFPDDGTVFDYAISSETAEFVPWSLVANSSNDVQLNRNPLEVFVHTAQNERLLQLVDLLSRVALHPVMLFGDMGSGKTSLIEEHLRSSFREESHDESVLRLHGSRFTNAKLLYERLMEKMDWKHGKTFVPKGNGKLLCIIDDIHLCQMDRFKNQSTLEFVRQHIDHGGFYGNTADHKWHSVSDVAYVLAANHRFSSRSSKLPSHRLTRHFAMIACHNPVDEELETIYKSILFKHFATPMLKPNSDPLMPKRTVSSLLDEQILLKEHYTEQQEALHSLLSLLIQVTIEVHDKASCMYLPTAERSHYIFNPGDLSVIFRNLCLSLQPGCKHESLLLLWEHECYWTYGRRMVSDIDFGRFRQTLTRAIEKNFTNQDHIRLLIEQEKQLFSNLVEHSSGLVTAGCIMGYASKSLTEEDTKTDLYRPVNNVAKVRGLLLRAVDEYNKSNPPITITLYKSVIEQVCRLARVIASPHKLAHTMLVAEGCAGRMNPIVNLAAHLCGFQVFKTTPAPVSSTRQETLASFKTDIMAAYTLAGVQGRKLLIVLEEEDLLDDDFLVYLTEFIMAGFISHLFSFEEQTTIINSIRTEVTQAGLAYTREVAWKYFLNTVKNNLRVCFVASGGGTVFQWRCRDYINFTKSVNIIWFPHWTKRQLLACATHHLRSMAWIDRVQAENVAHLLATMHLVIRQQDKKKQTNGHHKHLANLTYEKFIERFVSLANARHKEIQSLHEDMIKMNNKLILENSLASKLRKDLEHEKIVLEERKTGTKNLLSQIGQDAAIAEQQMKLVRAQMDCIKQLRTRLPEYQVARERAVYKTVAIVADTKKVVRSIKLNHDSEGYDETCGCLQCLRTKQKPPKDIEDLLEAVIMILKNPQADRTWQKGAKRQMANLERFIEELISFDENSLPEGTLLLVEAYLQKMSFEPEISKSSACVSLCNWIRGVARYHRMMISKVKPLHDQVTKTMKDIEGAEQKMKTLEVKRKALENRLMDLGKAFEEATIDKMDQLAKTIEMEKSLQMATELKQVLSREQRRIRHVIASLSTREACLTGSIAIAAAFATYLGPYHYRFRHEMLTVHWPACLQERGIPLVIDSVDQIRGHVVEWSMEDGVTDSESTEAELAEDENLLENQEREDAFLPLPESLPVAEDGQTEEGPFGMSNYDDEDEQGAEEEMRVNVAESGSEQMEKEDDYLTESSQTEIPYVMPAITTSQYRKYVQSIIKLLVGETRILDWINKGFSSLEMENTAILFTSWQRVPLLIDTMGNGMACYKSIIDQLNPKTSTMLDLNARMPESELVEEMEGCIIQGRPLMLSSCMERIDSFLMPLIEHFNSQTTDFASDQAPKLIRFRRRRMMCHPDFRLFLSTSTYNPKFSPTVVSMASPINYGLSNETVFDDILQRAFAILQPELSSESRKIQKNLSVNTKTLFKIKSEFGRKLLRAASEKKQFLSEVDLDEMSRFLHSTQVIATSIKEAKELIRELETIKQELFPLARRAAELFCILRSLAVVYQEYHFTYDFFIDLFDEALGGKPPQQLIDGFQEDEQKLTVDESKLSTEMMTDSIQTETKTNEKDGLSIIEESGTLNGSTADVGSGVETKEHPIYRVPHLPKLPSEGVQYAGMAESLIRQLVHRLTMLVLHRVRKSLYGENRLLFALLVSLVVCDGQQISEEEIALLVYGNTGFEQKLEPSDINSIDKMPDWLPSDKWQNLFAASLLPGPLNGLCRKIVENSAQWKMWYHSICPEQEDLPLEAQQQQQQQQQEDERSRTSLQQLIVLRLLRPDRLNIAVSSFVNETLQLDQEELPEEDLDQVLNTCHQGRHAVLVLVPPGGATSHALSSIETTQSVTESIEHLAKVREVALETVAMGTSSEERITSLLRSALTDGNKWILVTNVHLASIEYCKQLQYHLHLLTKNDDSNSSGGRCIVWLSAEPSTRLPAELLQYVYPLAWDSLQLMALTMGRNSVPADGAGLLTEKMDNFLPTAIVSGFQSVPVNVWTSVSELPPHFKSLIFCLGVTNGLLVTRQLLGSRGLGQFYPLEGGKYLRLTIEALLDLSRSHQGASDDQTEFFAKKIVQDIYGNVMASDHDQEYVRNVLDSACLAAFTGSDLRIGPHVLPIPPNDNVDALEFGAWLDVKLGSLHIAEALSMPADVIREINEATSSEFLQLLERAYTAQGFDLIDTSLTDNQHLSMLRLRTILDHLKKELPPPLLDLPTNRDVERGSVIHQDTDFSSFSVTSKLNNCASQDILGLVLLQECLCYNNLLDVINRDLVVIRGCLLGGKEFIPDNLQNVAFSLYNEQVPVSWIHTNHRPILHSLTSWKDDLIKQHRQLHTWTKHHSATEAAVDRWTGIQKFLSEEGVWLGGFVNPQALLMALRHKKSVALSCPVDEIELTCEILSSSNKNCTSSQQGDGITVRDLFLQGALWDTENKCLVLSQRKDLQIIPCLSIRAIRGMVANDATAYSCPIFMNRSRQVCICRLPFESSVPLTSLIASGAAIVLDPGLQPNTARRNPVFGLPNTSHLKLRSRSYYGDDRTYRGEGRAVEVHRGKYEETTDRSLPSAQSQLSYKPFSPNAPSLPPGLLLPSKEPPLDVKTSQASREKNEHPVVMDADGGVFQPEEEHSSNGHETLVDAGTEREEESTADEEDILQILQKAEKQKAEKETTSFAEKGDATGAKEENASLAESGEIESLVRENPSVIPKETTPRPEKKADSSRESKGILNNDKDVAGDEDSNEGNENYEDYEDDEDDDDFDDDFDD